ncbi:hypothetical protein FE257_006828 [Aspergillus nanangensis]|uniref:Altered inheritance of mitochondria protein 21 n=1 Tax=Aspergillus nanangensis TaxID=2582783 RepID=A0AAD4CNU2_ASPNN|nr:hypothetical protein FE257_006828 [Aspergillus nanangensis]
MTTQTVPSIPPRPTRSPHQQGLTPDMPRIPARPSRRVERSVSPLRDSYAPSPLNGPFNGSSLHQPVPADVPQRPPSVTIPSLGEEGIEYEDLDVSNHADGYHPSPAETRNVGSDLKLHAPRPSLPTSSAKAKVQAVTRTDSRSAAAAGLGRVASPPPDECSERASRSLHSRASGSRADSSVGSTDRRQSFDEHGIPEIGQRVPMYPNAGDVQAPSPSPYQTEFGSQRPGRSHQRSRSGREASLPPGSYGLHGHGVASNDKFEKAWYEKHPDEYVKEEQGQYGPGVGTPRPDWALSSDDLNKIVRGSAVTGSGLGTSPAVNGTPEEEVGFIASDEYMQRLTSPAPDSSRDSRPAVESPLRNEKSSNMGIQKESIEAKAAKSDGPDVIHVNEPYHHLHHPDGFAQAPDVDELVHGGAEGDEDEDETILAADEVRPESAHQHPAVSPTFGRRESFEPEHRSHTPSVSHSRSNSRNASHHSSTPTLARHNSRDEREDTHTPLEDVEEYEPLFPDDDQGKKPLSTSERFKKRPDMLKHRFPSQDIWEDSPNSLQLHATVSTPETSKHETFETPEQESFRRSHVPHLDPHKVASQILEFEDIEQEEKLPVRPDSSKQRFPSRDIWEDAPESHTLVTTIEPSDENETKSPTVPSKPMIPIRPQKRTQGPPVDASTKPTSPTEKRQPPSIPYRPKPQIPSRPAKPVGLNAEESVDAPAKVKPAVPARPGGNKIAALKAGFLSDLNSRLQVGPQGPPKPQEKKDEAPTEKAPLSDARKGRARGPARRRPAVENVAPKLPTIPEIRITESWNVWQVCEDGNLVVGSDQSPEPTETTPMAPPLSKNMAGESTDPVASPEPKKEISVSPPAATKTLETVIPTEEDEILVPTVPQSESEVPPCARPIKETPSSSESQVDEAAEALSASADGKKASDGDVTSD